MYILYNVLNDTSIKGSTSILAPTPEFCKCTYYTNLHICLFYTKVVRTEQMPLAGFRNPDYIRNVIYTLFMTFIQLPKKQISSQSTLTEDTWIIR